MSTKEVDVFNISKNCHTMLDYDSVSFYLSLNTLYTELIPGEVLSFLRFTSKLF